MQPGMDTSYSLSSSSGGGGGSGSGGIVSSSFTALSQPGRFVRFFLVRCVYLWFLLIVCCLLLLLFCGVLSRQRNLR